MIGLLFFFTALLGLPQSVIQVEGCALPQKVGTRFATFNASLNRKTRLAIEADLKSKANAQAHRIAQQIASVNPDVILLQEIDKGELQSNLDLFYKNYLRPALGDTLNTISSPLRKQYGHPHRSRLKSEW